MLKEMLKIDSIGTGSQSAQETSNSTPPAGQQQNRRRSSKKLGSLMISKSQANFFSVFSSL